MLAKKSLGAAPASVPAYVEDVFSTYLYTGTGSGTTITINNGIDVSGEGGLVWIKARSGADSHKLYDTLRGAKNAIYSNLTDAQTTDGALDSFTSTGFVDKAGWNTSTTLASFTFRKAEKFFDVVTWTGNGVDGRQISHNLGVVPGCIIVKCTSNAENWLVWHRSFSSRTNLLQLNTTNSVYTDTRLNTNALPTSTYFEVGNDGEVNASGRTYVAYLFAHDAGGFGDAGDQSVIKCGSYTGNGDTNGLDVSLGWEPQWVLVKQSSESGNYWLVADNMRGMTADMNSQILYPNASDAEVSLTRIGATATGFKVYGGSGSVNNNGSTYIYIAIRRGPMKTPEVGTEIYNAYAFDGNDGTQTYSNGFPTDFLLHITRNTGGYSRLLCDRLRGKGPRLNTAATDAESNLDIFNFDKQDSVSFTSGSPSINASGTTYIHYNFGRASGFFDVVCYTGTGSATTVTHNLGVAPELMIVKRRSNADNWFVYAQPLGNTGKLELDGTAAANTSSPAWNSTSPTSSVFSVGTDTAVNGSGSTYVAYLFASVTGVSKVGSYTGTGTTLQVNCGFTNGARFVLIKRTDSTGDWYVWDSTRGIVSGNDPYVLINSQNAEVTNTDYIDTYSSGFEISSTAPAAINSNGGTFIYLAIA
jgi:hypothetical protein